MKKLLLISNNSVHTYNYIDLIKDYFDDILLITNEPGVYKGKSISVNFSLRNAFTVIKTIVTIREQCKSFKPDIIHIHQANTCAFLTLLATNKFNIPKILTAWGSDILFSPHKGLLYKQMVKYILKNSNFFTADSVFLSGQMRNLLPEKKLKITIANFGIVMNSSNTKKNNLIYSNRSHNELYRIDLIIKAFAKFRENRKNENWKLIIAGSGNDTVALKKLANEFNLDEHILFPGWLNKDENMKYYNLAKIYVSIPKSDATSISLLEAMSSGCIPVLSNIPANMEWVIDNLNGVIVEDLNDNFFENALQVNFIKANQINCEIIQNKAEKEVNKKKFISLYNRLLN